MNKIILSFVLLLLSGMFFNTLFAQEKQKNKGLEFDTVSALEEKRELLKLHDKYIALQIRFLEKQHMYEQVEQKAKNLTKLADQTTKDYQSIDSKEVRKELSRSKETQKTLAKSERANRKLSRIKKQMRDLEDNMRSIERKIALENYTLEISEK